jgi:hypothetical protein
MRIAKQTPTVLTIKTNEKTKLLISGVVILVVGLLIVYLLRIQPLSQSDLQFSRLLSQQQEGDASLELETQQPSENVPWFYWRCLVSLWDSSFWQAPTGTQ